MHGAEFETDRMPSLTAMDMFAGCGGLSLGMRQAGLDVRYAVELDRHSAATYQAAHPNTRVFVEDATVLYSRLLDGGPDLPSSGEIDVLSGGPPCQGFSGYNRHRRPSDPRNSLVETFFDFAAYLKPRFVLMENVPGMLAMSGGRVAEQLLDAFHALGYRTRLGILQAGSYGVPQNRWRVFIWGARSGEPLPSFPTPHHTFPRTTVFGVKHFRSAVVAPADVSATLFATPLPAVTVGDAISDLPAIENGGGWQLGAHAHAPRSEYQHMLRAGTDELFDHQCVTLTGVMYERCQAVPRRRGAGWRDLPSHLQPANLLRHGDGRYPNRFGRLHWEGVFNTILTRAFPYWGTVFHPEQDRVISVRESARAQGIPDCVRFSGPLSSRYRQVGNAVPPPLAAAIVRELTCSVGHAAPGSCGS